MHHSAGPPSPVPADPPTPPKASAVSPSFCRRTLFTVLPVLVLPWWAHSVHARMRITNLLNCSFYIYRRFVEFDIGLTGLVEERLANGEDNAGSPCALLLSVSRRPPALIH